jgi:16S rRNA (cytosine1402-N4)-methyltransferase
VSRDCSAAAHSPVMVTEVLAGLLPRDGAIYVDATFGAGGYARAILDAAGCTVIGIDRDPEACRRAAALIARYGGRLRIIRGRFGAMVSLMAELAIARVDGIAFDLGVSSPQLDVAARGFSFRLDGPLDMRMDPEQGLSAANAVNALPEGELARILETYGEERAARRIAAAMVRARTLAPIATTADLARIVRTVLPAGRGRIDPATRTFQALRIYINDELGELEQGLAAAETLLGPGGRLCVVAFHSLEDRQVKAFLKERSGVRPAPSRHRPEPGAMSGQFPTFRLVRPGAVRPSREEIVANPRARSARLRIAERTGAPPWPNSKADRRAA